VFIVDDDPGVRESLSMLVGSISLRAETFASAQQFLETVTPQRSGCLVLDLRLPVMSGLELQRQLVQRRYGLPVVFISGHGDVPTAVRAMQDGAISFLEKPFRSQDLLECIQRALDQDAAMRSRHGENAVLFERLATLTRREHEVLDCIATGKPHKSIAADLGISRKTLDVHRANIMRKLQAESVADLVRIVMQTQGARATGSRTNGAEASPSGEAQSTAQRLTPE
jgi:FixJ family two-component response regulator